MPGIGSPVGSTSYAPAGPDDVLGLRLEHVRGDVEPAALRSDEREHRGRLIVAPEAPLLLGVPARALLEERQRRFDRGAGVLRHRGQGGVRQGKKEQAEGGEHGGLRVRGHIRCTPGAVVKARRFCFRMIPGTPFPDLEVVMPALVSPGRVYPTWTINCA